MDLTSIIEIAIVIVVIYFFLKFIVSPIIKIIVGIIIFLVLVYLLQRFFGFDLSQVLAPFGISSKLSSWNLNLNWILGPANYYIDQMKNFLNFIWGNFPKSLNQ